MKIVTRLAEVGTVIVTVVTAVIGAWRGSALTILAVVTAAIQIVKLVFRSHADDN
jgi:hypothetical protein